MAQVSLNTRVSLETSAALDKYAADTGQSKASIVEAALKVYIQAATQAATVPPR